MDIQLTLSSSATPAAKGPGQGKKNKPKNTNQNPNQNQPQSPSGTPGPPSQNQHQKKQKGPGPQQQQQQQQQGGPANENQNPGFKRPQHQHQNQNPNRFPQKQNQNPNYQNQKPNYNKPPAKTGLGQGKGKKYDTNTCVFISGVELQEGQSALKFTDNLFTDDMALDFRALEIIKLDPHPDDEGTGKTLVAIFSNSSHVDEIIKKAREFKSKEQFVQKYGDIQFEGYLTPSEQRIKRATLHRVNELNQKLSGIPNAKELGLEAQIVSKESYKHLGLDYVASYYNPYTILWKSFQPLKQLEGKKESKKGPRSTSGSSSVAEEGAAGGGHVSLYGQGQLQSGSGDGGEGDEFTLVGLPDVPAD